MSDEALTNKREAILQSAHQLFVQQGYHGTSMRQIADLAGVSLGGLYNHFPSGKEAIFEADFIENHPFREIMPTLLTTPGDNLEDFVRNAARLLFASLQDRTDYLNLMFIEIVEFRSVHVSKLFNLLFPMGVEIAQRMQNIGRDNLRPIPALVLLRSFLSLFFSYYITDLIIAPASPPEFQEGAMYYFIEIYLHGILADQ